MIKTTQDTRGLFMQSASESKKTIKARKKLAKQLAELDKKITQEALTRKKTEINLWLAKYANSRIVVTDRLAKPSSSLSRRIIEVTKQAEKEKQVASKFFHMV